MNVESSPPTGTVRCCSDDVMCVLNPTQARRDAPERVAGCDRCRVHLLYRRLRRCVLVVTVEGDSSRRHRCALCWLCNSSGAYRLGLPVSCWAELLVPSSKCVSPCVMVYVRACPSKWPAVCVYVLATWQCYDSDGEFCAPLYQLRQLLVACLAVLVTQVVLTSLYFTLAPRGRLFLAVLMASAQEATAFTTKVRTLKVLGLLCAVPASVGRRMYVSRVWMALSASRSRRCNKPRCLCSSQNRPKKSVRRQGVVYTVALMR